MQPTEPELSKRFERVNRLYFQGEYHKVRIIWSKNISAINHLGKKCWARYFSSRLFVLNICLKGKCPNYVLEYLIYHECLHLYWVIHCKEFKHKEQQFKHYHKAEAWLTKHKRIIKAGRS